MAGAGIGRGAVTAYGVLGLPLAFAALPVYVHVPKLYGEFVGMNLGLLGAILLLARLADAVVDPAIGHWSDRTGNRRLLILLGLPILAGGFFMLLRPPPAAGIAWLLPTLIATYAGYSLSSIAYQAWGAELGSDSSTRTRLTASREGFGCAGIVAASALPFLLAVDLSQGLARMAIVFLPLLALAALLSLRVDMAMAPRGAAPGLPPALFDSLRACLAVRRFVRLLAAFVANGIAAALPATLVLFYVADVLGAAAASGYFLLLYFVAGIAGLSFWVKLGSRIGRVAAWRRSMLMAVAVFAAAPFLGHGDVLPFAFICVLSGLALGADLALPAALVADYAQSRSADRSPRAGAYFGCWNLVTKLNLALAAGIGLPLLAQAGYVPGDAAGAEALAVAYGALPILFKLIAAGMLWRWQDLLESRS